MRILIASLVCFALSGCATTWYNSNFPTEESKQAQLKIDSGYCEAASYGSVPMPSVRVYLPDQQSYNVYGTASGYNSQSGFTNYSYSGTVAPSRSSSFSTGFSQGMALGEIMKADAARKKVLNACMMELGWSDKPVPSVGSNSLQSTRTSATEQQPSLLVSSVAPASEPTPASGPIMIACGIFLDNETPTKYLGGNRTYKYIIDPKLRTVKKISGKALTVRSWSEVEIITEDKSSEFDTQPPIASYDIHVFDRVTGAYHQTFVWKTDQGKVVSGDNLAAIAGKHPMWQQWPFGIWEARIANGDCQAEQKKF